MLTSDRDIVLAAVKVHGRLLEDADQFLKKQRSCFGSVQEQGDMIFEADKKLQNDKSCSCSFKQ